jgi:hypothetical protein
VSFAAITLCFTSQLVFVVVYFVRGDNIKMDLREMGIDGADWIRLAQDRVQWRAFVNTVMKLRVP